MMTYLDTECLSFVVLENTVDVLYSYWKDPPGHLFTSKGTHTHSSPEVHYAVGDPVDIVIEGKQVHIDPGDAVIIAPDVIHAPCDPRTRTSSFTYDIHERVNGLDALVPQEKYLVVHGVDKVYIRVSDGKMVTAAGESGTTVELPNVTVRGARDSRGNCEVTVTKRNLV